jgi:hypothetical protein
MDYQDIPRVLPSGPIAKALFGASAPEGETEEAMPAFAEIGSNFGITARQFAVLSPSEEVEELQLKLPAPIRKLFSPRVNRTSPPKLADLPVLPAEPADAEREYFAAISEVHKLFHPTPSSVTIALRKSADGSRDGWDEQIAEPLAKSATVSPLDRVFADNVKAYTEKIAKRAPITDTSEFSPELASLIEQIVAGLDPWNEDEESESAYDRRVARELNTALVAAGQRPVLSY